MNAASLPVPQPDQPDMGRFGRRAPGNDWSGTGQFGPGTAGSQWSDQPEVGQFDQGTPGSRWALGRYLVGRAIGEYLSRALLVVALAVLALAVLVGWIGPTWLAVLIGLVSLSVLLLRWLLGAVLRSVTGARTFGPMESRMRRLVAETRGDVRTELRRVGVPSRTWTMPLLALRLARRRRRAETLTRLRGFEVERVVPRSRLDELHLIVRQLRR